MPEYLITREKIYELFFYHFNSRNNSFSFDDKKIFKYHSEMREKSLNQKMGVILLANLINVLGFSVVIPVLPFYVESMGLNAIIVTSLFAVFAFCEFLSAPYLGSMSEKYGRRPILLLSIFSSFLGWVIFALAKNPLFLFLGRAVDGLAAGNFTIMQNIIGDIAEDRKERVKWFGLFGATFGIGFIIGPVLGGVLSKISINLPFFAVAGLSLLSFILVWNFLPESHKHMDKSRELDINPLKPIFRVLKEKRNQRTMLVWFLLMAAMGGVQSVSSLFLKDIYGFDVTGISAFMMVISFLMILNQIFLMKIWTHDRRENKVEKIFLLMLGVAYLMITSHWTIALLSIPLIAIGEGTMRALLSDRMFSDAGPKEKGEMVGVQGSVMALAAAISSYIAGVLFVQNQSWPFIFSFILALGAFILALKFKKRAYHPEPDMV